MRTTNFGIFFRAFYEFRILFFGFRVFSRFLGFGFASFPPFLLQLAISCLSSRLAYGQSAREESFDRRIGESDWVRRVASACLIPFLFSFAWHSVCKTDDNALPMIDWHISAATEIDRKSTFTHLVGSPYDSMES